MRSDDAIIYPLQGKHSSKPGAIAVMVSNGDDLLLLTKQLGLNEVNHQHLYMSRLFTCDKPMVNFSAVGPFIGAPYAVMLLETLIAWGVKKIVFWGWCGAISPDVKIGDFLVPNGAIADEGTSKHYQHNGQYPAFPTEQLTGNLKRILKNQEHSFHEGIVWTTDGVFRETREKVTYFQQQHVLAVEMELSAVFSVAYFRHVEICALLVVSDELSSLQWHSGFTDKRFQNSRRTACKITSDFCQML